VYDDNFSYSIYVLNGTVQCPQITFLIRKIYLSMLGVKFQKNKNITFLVCNKGIFSQEERLFLDSPFK